MNAKTRKLKMIRIVQLGQGELARGRTLAKAQKNLSDGPVESFDAENVVKNIFTGQLLENGTGKTLCVGDVFWTARTKKEIGE